MKITAKITAVKKLNFSIIADILFYAACVWIFSLCIMRYYRIPLWISALSASLIAVAVGVMVFLVLSTRNHKRLLNKKEREACDALLLHLALDRPERVRGALLSAFTADEREVHCERDALSVDGLPVIPLFAMEPISADEIARLIRSYGEEKFAVACKALTPEAEKLLASFSLKAYRGDDIYALFTRTGTTPEPLICGEIPRRTVKTKLHRSFSKKNARPFFVSGLLLLIMSLFTFFPVYYIISGSILLVCAVTVRLFGFAA